MKEKFGRFLGYKKYKEVQKTLLSTGGYLV